MEKFVTLPLKRLKDLISKENTLLELENAGVDNWQGIEECGELYAEVSDEEVEYEFTIFEE